MITAAIVYVAVPLLGTVRSWRLAHPRTNESIKTVAAITLLRDSTGMTLREAKDAVDQL